jgi:citronellol/citronellal dehydrogenase
MVPRMSLAGKTLFITGSSRGIGRAIALRCAADGANIAVVAKTAEPNPKLPGTIYTVADEIVAAGGQALPLVCDVRDTDRIEECVEQTARHFGGIDGVMNNAGAIMLTPVEMTPMKRVDLMFQVNLRATYAVSRSALPFLKKAGGGHIINMSPPAEMIPEWFAMHTAYTISKFGMSMCTMGMSAEFKKYGIGVNSVWPRTVIDTMALRHLPGGTQIREHGRTPAIVADAVYSLLNKDPKEVTGNWFLDEEILRNDGVTDFGHYSVVPGNKLLLDVHEEGQGKFAMVDP